MMSRSCVWNSTLTHNKSLSGKVRYCSAYVLLKSNPLWIRLMFNIFAVCSVDNNRRCDSRCFCFENYSWCILCEFSLCVCVCVYRDTKIITEVIKVTRLQENPSVGPEQGWCHRHSLQLQFWEVRTKKRRAEGCEDWNKLFKDGEK